MGKGSYPGKKKCMLNGEGKKAKMSAKWGVGVVSLRRRYSPDAQRVAGKL